MTGQGRGKGFNKKTGIFLITYHILLVIGWMYYFSNYSPSIGMIVTTVVLFFLTGMSITGGYHRHYSHTTYKTNPVFETIMLFFASMAAQGSALRWSFEHRLHHAYVDTDSDPYSIKKGFWYAHILWLFQKPLPIEKKVVPDLYKNPRVVFQHDNYLACMVGSNIIAFLLVGYFLQDYLGAFILAWWTRLFVLHHSTWFINSLAHYWGAQTFSKELSAVDNYVISLLTFGEGYHNYHHTFANDYRNGIRWYHYDPTKWTLWFLNIFGVVHGLKRASYYHVKERMLAEQKKLLFDQIQTSPVKKDEITEKITQFDTEIMAKISYAKKLVEQYTQSKKENNSKDDLKKLKLEIKATDKSINKEWRRCQRFLKHFGVA